jgi:phage tail P2-like protein
MTSLLPINASQFERDLETVSSRIDSLPIDIRDSWNADTCPIDLLPWLAWAFSIDSWKTYWPEHVKRSRVRDALAIQRKKGTRGSVRQVVKSFGAELEFKEWFEQTPIGPPHSFNVLLNVNDMGPQTNLFTTDIVQEVSRTKSVSSYFEVQQGVTVTGSLALIGQLRIVKYLRIGVTDA